MAWRVTSSIEHRATTAAPATIRQTDPTPRPPCRPESQFFSSENAVSCRAGRIRRSPAEELVDVPAEVVGVEGLGLRRHGEVDGGEHGPLDVQIEDPLGGLDG